jgi:hypothetical protein
MDNFTSPRSTSNVPNVNDALGGTFELSGLIPQRPSGDSASQLIARLRASKSRPAVRAQLPANIPTGSSSPSKTEAKDASEERSKRAVHVLGKDIPATHMLQSGYPNIRIQQRERQLNLSRYVLHNGRNVSDSTKLSQLRDLAKQRELHFQ